MSDNIIAQNFQVTRRDRNLAKGHQSFVLWFTGLSGSGKSTIANEIEKDLFQNKIHTFSLDGDNVRLGLNKGLGFTEADREENIRRIAEVSKLFVDAGIVVLASFVSPLIKDREKAKDIIGAKNFIEIFVSASLEECERRDIKGLYKKARAGEIKNFTGIDAPYEAPLNPDVLINTEIESLEQSKEIILNFLKDKLELESNE